MKEKILVALKTRYRNFGFGDKAFDGVADYLSKTVTEESQLETAVGGVEGLLKAFQGDIDTVRNEKSGLQRQLDELKKETGKPGQESEGKEGDVPVWAQALLDSHKGLMEEISTLKQEKEQAARQGQILAKAKEYGIPENYAKRCAIKDDEDLDAYFKDLRQDFANDGFKGVPPPETAEQKMERENESIARMISDGTRTIVESKK